MNDMRRFAADDTESMETVFRLGFACLFLRNLRNPWPDIGLRA